MKFRKILALTLMLMLVASYVVYAAEEEGKLILSDSFENNKPGEVPVGWEGVGQSIIDSTTLKKIADGDLAVKLDNSPSAAGGIYKEFESLNKNRLLVSFYQPSKFKENVNIEVTTADGQRIFGLFITGSGNVRIRDAGVQSGNIIQLANDNWHRVMLEWDAETKTYHAYVIMGKTKTEVTPKKGARFDPALDDNPPKRINFEVSKREDPKVAYIDHVELYDLSK